MHYLQTLIYLLAFSIKLCHGLIFTVEKCPPVKVMGIFNVDKFRGDWYVMQRFNPMASCVKMRFVKNPEGEFTVTQTSKPHLVKGDSVKESFVFSERKLKFESNQTDAIFKINRGFGREALRTFGVIDTNFVSYALIWGCEPLYMGSFQNFDVLSRSAEDNQNLIQYAQDKLEEIGVDYKHLRPVFHRNCGEQTAAENVNNMFVDFRKI